jgi:uncharacterized protein YgiM (DUF1202 family)
LSYAAGTGTITTMSEKIYQDMDEDGAVVGNVIMGSTFSLLDAQYDIEGNIWYMVETDAGIIGYIRSEKVTDSDSAQTGVPVTSQENAQQTDNQEQNIDNNDNENNITNDNNADINNTDNNANTTDNTLITNNMNGVNDVNNDNIATDNNNVSTQQGNVKTQVMAVETINIRQEASTDSNIVGKLPQAIAVDSLGVVINEEGEKWYEISYNGIQGYVMEQVVNVTETVEEVPQTETATTQTTVQASNTSSTETAAENEETKSEEVSSTAANTDETNTNTSTKSKFHFYIDWVIVFSFLGCLLCIGGILKLIKSIKKLTK